MVKVERAGRKPITTEGHDATLIVGHVRIGKRRTTLHLESALWNLLRDIAAEQGLTLDELCTDIAEVTAADATFAQAARCYVLGHLWEQIPDELLPEEIRKLREQSKAITAASIDARTPQNPLVLHRTM